MTTQEKQAERRRLWGERIGEQKQSGKSIRAYCRERGEKEQAFYYWRQVLRRPAKPLRFALVESNVNLPGQKEKIEILLTSGERMQVAPGVDVATLRLVLGVLREAQA